MKNLPFHPKDIRILIIENNTELLVALRQTLQGDGYEVVEARDGKTALEKINNEGPNLVIVDLNLRDKKGGRIAKNLQSMPNTPFIILSDKSDPKDSVEGLLMGADDYIVKPLYLKEFSARVQAVLRRLYINRGTDEHIVNMPPIKIDMMARIVWLGDRIIHLSPLEYRILVTLAQHPGHIYSREQLAEAIWHRLPSSYLTSLPVYIWRIRQKLERDPRKPELVTSVHGKGYRLVLPRV